MKTVCKKLLCLMLVAMMLISAIPAAFAAEEVKCDKHPNAATAYRGVAEADVAATCDKAGTKSYFCNGAAEVGGAMNGEEAHNFDVVVAAATGNHTWNEGVVTTAATCGAAGVKTFTCTVCNTTKTEAIAATGAHTWGTATQTKAPTCTEKGANSFTCTACGAGKTEDIAALGHKPNANGVCSVCEHVEEATYVLTFYYLNAEGNPVGVEAVIKNGDKITLPTIPLVNGKDFLYWKDGDGNQVDGNTVWNIGESKSITAIYESDTTDDGLVGLTVYVSYYVDGKWHHEAKLYTEMFEKSDKNTMFEWLYSDAGKKQTRDALEAKGYFGYDWSQVKYYDYYDDGEVTKADLKSDGNKTVYIKVHSTDAIEASVMLYVHTKETATVDRVIPMPGYTEGDYVTFADVKAAVKTKYSGSNMTISDLYTKGDWEDLLDDIKSSGSRSIKVEDNGTTEIHVIVKNATSGSSNADSSNPKTGDSIMIAVTTMGLAAAAMVALVELKKRKMI